MWKSVEIFGCSVMRVHVQAGSNLEGNLKNVEKLVTHPAFSITNPNACYSLFLAFLRSPVNFHAADGSGYNFIADSILKVTGFPGVHAFGFFGVLPRGGFVLLPIDRFLVISCAAWWCSLAILLYNQSVPQDSHMRF